MNFKIRKYQTNDEESWLKCRVIAFLQTAYFDNVLQQKEKYHNPAIELVAVANEQVIGLLDIELDTEQTKITSKCKERGAVIWHIAVLPEYQRLGIARKLLAEGQRLLKEIEIREIEAWTRDDEFVNKWYLKNGFTQKDSYYHVYTDGDECDKVSKSLIPKLYICNTFCHYLGDNPEELKKKFKRVHECKLYLKEIYTTCNLVYCI